MLLLLAALNRVCSSVRLHALQRNYLHAVRILQPDLRVSLIMLFGSGCFQQIWLKTCGRRLPATLFTRRLPFYRLRRCF
jgi:hypothetical protein